MSKKDEGQKMVIKKSRNPYPIERNWIISGYNKAVVRIQDVYPESRIYSIPSITTKKAGNKFSCLTFFVTINLEN